MTNPAATAATTSPLTPTESGVRGRFLWHDLITSDVAAAVAFYTAVTGWTVQEMPTGEGQPPYTMWVNAAGEPVGGAAALTSKDVAMGTGPYWMSHVGTPDARSTYAEAMAAGASSLVPPTAIPGIGYYAVLADPQGATFAIYEPEAVATEPTTAALGSFSWHELATSDQDAAIAFYARLFGWESRGTHDMKAMGTYELFGRGAHVYGGVFTREKATVPPNWLVYVRVADLEGAGAAVAEHGGEVMFGPCDVPGGDRITICRDPQGGMFALHCTAPAGDAGAAA